MKLQDATLAPNLHQSAEPGSLGKLTNRRAGGNAAAFACSIAPIALYNLRALSTRR
jgi:hypothetical protein